MVDADACSSIRPSAHPPIRPGSRTDPRPRQCVVRYRPHAPGRLRPDRRQPDGRRSRHDARQAVSAAPELLRDAVHRPEQRPRRRRRTPPLALHAEHDARSGHPDGDPGHGDDRAQSHRAIRRASARAVHGSVRPQRLDRGRRGRCRHADAARAGPSLLGSDDLDCEAGWLGAADRDRGEFRPAADDHAPQCYGESGDRRP